MKTSFKKTVAMLLVSLMLFSVVSVTAAAATIYTITYEPGNYAKETETYTQEAEKGVKVTLRGETYTRTGYTQTGWSNNIKATSRTYALERNGTITKNLTLYPYFTANKYTITFDGGEFGVGTAQSKEVTFDKETTAPGAIFTRDGYVQIGWTATVIEITTDADGKEVLTPVEVTIGLGEKTATVTGDATYTPVWEKVTIEAAIVLSGSDFGAVCEAYSAPAAETVTITNTGNVTLNYTLPESDSYEFAVVRQPS